MASHKQDSSHHDECGTRGTEHENAFLETLMLSLQVDLQPGLEDASIESHAAYTYSSPAIQTYVARYREYTSQIQEKNLSPTVPVGREEVPKMAKKKVSTTLYSCLKNLPLQQTARPHN